MFINDFRLGVNMKVNAFIIDKGAYIINEALKQSEIEMEVSTTYIQDGDVMRFTNYIDGVSIEDQIEMVLLMKSAVMVSSVNKYSSEIIF